MEPVGSLLKQYLESHNLRSDSGYPALFRGWRTVIHGQLVEHSRVLDVKNRVLIVEVDHPGWRQILLLQKVDILKKVHRLFPELEIADIKTVLIKDSKAPKIMTTAVSFAGASQKENKDHDEILTKSKINEEDDASTTDDRFRSILCSLYRQIVERSNSD